MTQTTSMIRFSCWTTKDIPNLTGKIAIVTGGTRGIGLCTAIGLVSAGADVIIIGSNSKNGDNAVSLIKSKFQTARITYSKVDFGSLEEIGEFARWFNGMGVGLDILVNNAGIYPWGRLQKTVDGIESTFGINHLAPFALTAQLLPSLRRSVFPRIVNVSSTCSYYANIQFDDLQYAKAKYFTFYHVYAQSKLANLLFTSELQKMSDKNGWGLSVVSASPGLTRSDMLQAAIDRHPIFGLLFKWTLQPWITHSVEEGAKYLLFAATSSDAVPGEFYGPTKFKTCTGPINVIPKPVIVDDPQIAERLWKVSEELVGIKWT